MYHDVTIMSFSSLGTNSISVLNMIARAVLPKDLSQKVCVSPFIQLKFIDQTSGRTKWYPINYLHNKSNRLAESSKLCIVRSQRSAVTI